MTQTSKCGEILEAELPADFHKFQDGGKSCWLFFRYKVSGISHQRGESSTTKDMVLWGYSLAFRRIELFVYPWRVKGTSDEDLHCAIIMSIPPFSCLSRHPSMK